MKVKKVTKDKLQKLSTIFVEKTGVPLFIELPIKEIDSISKRVISLDSLRCRLIDLCNIFDRFNKKQFDNYSTIHTQGSKTSLINVLKKICFNNHDEINEIEKKIDYLYLMRDYYTHGKNKSIKKAFDYLKIQENDYTKYKYIWNKAFQLFEIIINDVSNLINDDVDYIKQEKIDEDSILFFENIMIGSCKSLLSNPEYKKYILRLLSEEKITDMQLAKEFNISVFELRKKLLNLFPRILEITFFDLDSTYIAIKKGYIESIKNFYNEEKYED